MRTRLAIFMALALAVVGQSCGDGSEEPAATAGPIATGETTTLPDTPTGGGDEPGTPEPDDRLDGDLTTLPERVPDATEPPILGEVPDEYLRAIIDDAAGRQGVAPDAATVLRAQAVAWNDGSLGCAKPGEAYTQAIVLGYWVILDAGGIQLDYRLNDRGQFVLCEPPFATPPGTVAPSS